MFDFDDNEIGIVEQVRDERTEKMIEYIRSLNAIEEAMEPYKEQKRALKSNYVENGWLEKDEISMAVRAYRLIKTDTDIEQLIDYYERVSSTVGK